ncbi:MAG: agmatine deiminase family protein [Planctomycetes bacterium]|nr:agmatine deiminase family protein [Planctomycetota bacterium]
MTAEPLAEPLYRMPAEWEPHEAAWLSWPHKRESWPGIFERIPPVWAAMIRALRESEEVRLLSRDEAMDAEVRAALGGDLSGVRLHRVPTNDAWIRDYGPIFVRPADPGAACGAKVLVSWGYNAWGGKYGPWDLDDAVPGELGRLLGLPVVEAGMILEGGSIDSDGEGTLLTTESCLLNPNRNPSLDRGGIEERLRRFLGARKVLWLGDGIAGDDTDGHVDDLTRFVAPGCVVTAVEEDERDENHRPLRENLERLRGMRDACGRRLEVVELPMPPPVHHQGQRCPASYMNFLIANRAVLVPTFRSERDRRALGILGEVFPGRKVVGIDCVDMVWGLGAVHCVTQQEPR